MTQVGPCERRTIGGIRNCFLKQTPSSADRTLPCCYKHRGKYCPLNEDCLGHVDGARGTGTFDHVRVDSAAGPTQKSLLEMTSFSLEGLFPSQRVWKSGHFTHTHTHTHTHTLYIHMCFCERKHSRRS